MAMTLGLQHVLEGHSHRHVDKKGCSKLAGLKASSLLYCFITTKLCYSQQKLPQDRQHQKDTRETDGTVSLVMSVLC